MKYVLDVEVGLVLVETVGHEDDVEVCGGLEEGNVGYKNCGVLSAVFLKVVEVGDGEGYWVRGGVLREETMAVAIRAASIPAPKN